MYNHRDLGRYNFSSIINEIINKKSQLIDANNTDSGESNTANIRALAWKKYSNNDVFKTSDLNKKIFLDIEFASLLTANTLRAIFHIAEASDNGDILLNRENDTHSTIYQVICDSVADGADALELIPDVMPNNQSLELDEHRDNFQQHTANALNNILMLAKTLEINIDDFAFLYKQDSDSLLSTRLNNIIAAIDSIVEKEGLTKLLPIAENFSNYLENESIHEFTNICKSLGFIIDENSNTTNLDNCQNLEYFTKVFLQHSNSFIYTRSTIDLFLEKLHLQACLLSTHTFKMGEYEYTIRDILKSIIKAAENDPQYQPLCLQLKLRIQLIERHLSHLTPRNYLPDNALRMIQLLEKYQTDVMSPSSKENDYFIKRLMQTKTEEHARQVFTDLPKDLYPSVQYNELGLASRTNVDLLSAADIAMSVERKAILDREIEGRLLRFDKVRGVELDIERQLKSKTVISSIPEPSYPKVLISIANDFAKQTTMIHNYFSSREAERSNTNKGRVLKEIFSGWKVPICDENGMYQDACENLIKMRDQLLDLQLKLPQLKDIMEENRDAALSHLLAAFVALGCILVPIIGVPITCYYMYRSWCEKGTVFFTHAPESMRIAPATEESLKKLGRV